MFKQLMCVVCFIVGLSAVGSASAAMITWDGAFDVTGPSDVVTDGTVHEAINCSALEGQVVVNGVTFMNSNDLLPGSVNQNFLAGNTTGDEGLDELLNKLDYGGGTSTTISMGGGTLTPGAIYVIQVWFTDLRSASMNRVMTFGDGLGNTVDLHASQGGFGQYGVGTFTADATGSQTLSLITNGFGNAHFTAYQVRLIGFPTNAVNPDPGDGATDVSRDTALGWLEGKHAQTHDVYLGTVFDDVNDADRDDPRDVLLSQDHSEMTFDPGRLDFGQTYYWRVDEVNDAPDNTIFKGDVWSFTTELFAYPIENVMATSNVTSAEDQGPERLVDGSGLDADDQHSTDIATMWTGIPESNEPSYLQFEFARVEKLHEMVIWNYNINFESVLGMGVKEATIEYSEDGMDWTMLDDVELAQGWGDPTYTANSTIGFEGVPVQFVRMTINSTFSGSMDQFGLSEVRFTSIPVQAGDPNLEDGATDVAIDTTLSWTPGREAVSHEVYISTDPNALDHVGTTTENSYPISLDLDTTYYWQIVEVNEAEPFAAWAGDVWSFSTEPSIVVDTFDDYIDDAEGGDVIWEIWVDGLVAFGGDAANGGSVVGHDTSPFAEQTIVRSGQSMPLYFNNAGGQSHSQAKRTFATAEDWTAHGIQSLTLYVYGDADNVGGRLYVKINEAKVYYDSVSDVLQREQWMLWPIDLTQVDTDLSSVTSLSIGIDDAGASGVVYVDDIYLVPQGVEVVDPVLPENSDPNLAAYYAFEGNADDSTGNYPGTIVGSPEYVQGVEGQGILLDGVTTHVVHDLAADEVWPAYSLSLWVRTDTFGQAIYSGLFNNNSASSDFQIEADGTDPGNYNYRGTATGAFGSITSDWVHLGVSCDGATTSLYYNGLYVRTLNVADTNFGQIAIGINRGMSKRFDGTIDEVRVYNRVLSSGEIAGLAGVTESILKLAF